MMQPIIKNVPHNEPFTPAEQTAAQPGQIVSKTLAQNKAVSVTLFSFAAGQEISTHESDGDALVLVLDGEGEFDVGESTHTLAAGQALVMPARVPHAVRASQPFSMLLTVVF